MDLAVDRILAEREQLARRGPAVASLAAAVLLHLGVAALVLVLPRLAAAPPPLDYVAVQVVPAQRLGGERTASQPRAEAPSRPRVPPPQPPPQQQPPPKEEPPLPPRSPDAPVLPRAVPQPQPPKPVKPAKPAPLKPPPPDTRFDPTTRPQVLPPPREVLAKKLGPAAVASPPNPVPGPPGATTGSATAKVEVGSSGLDNPDFTYDYYIAQLVSRIDQNWTRPPVGDGVRAIVSFRIRSDGSITGLTVRVPSSFDTFDLAALRAVQNAAPFPPLPRAYTLQHDSVGVNVTLR